MKVWFACLMAPILFSAGASFYHSYQNYRVDQLVHADTIDVELLGNSISPIYSDALYFLANEYEVIKQEEFDLRIEQLYSEVAWHRPLSPSSWINLATWSSSHELYDNSVAYLRSALLLLRNKPIAAWDLVDLILHLQDRDLAVSIAGNYLAADPKKFNGAISTLEESNEIDENFIADVIVNSINDLEPEAVMRLLSNYLIESIKLGANEKVMYLFDFIEINALDINATAANSLRNYLIKQEDYAVLRRVVKYFDNASNFSFSGVNINAKGQFCWRLLKKSDSFEWNTHSVSGAQRLMIKFNGSQNIHFTHLNCGFFLPEDEGNSAIKSSLPITSSITFSLEGEKITTASGIYAEVYQPNTGRLVSSVTKTGTWEAETLSLKFSSADRSKPFYFRLRRNKTRDIDNLFSGTVTISDFSLTD